MGTFRLTSSTAIETKDEHDEKFERCFLLVQGIVENLSEKDAHDKLQTQVILSPQAHEEVVLGLLMLILSEPHNAPRWYRDLNYVARDGLGTAAGALQVIIVEKFHKLTDTVRDQVFWLLKEMIKGNIKDMENVFYNLLRIIAGGDVTPKNIWLTNAVLNIVIEHRAWVERFPILIAATAYTYLRLIEDHLNPLFKELRQKEVNFVVSILRERFTECSMIGRDLVRLLINVGRIPEFERLWMDLITSPSTLAPNFSGIDQLMVTRTSRRFLLLRITPDMEKKVVFLLNYVRNGEQTRYLDWFQRQYLSTPESQSLRCDLIRFICGVIHPTNEILSSNIFPRWAMVGWLLNTCTSPAVNATLKLAIFLDWLYYDPIRDNIMNIEPGALLMNGWQRRHPARTATLLDFLCRISTQFHPSIAHQVTQGIKASFAQILEKRVLLTLNVIFESAGVDKDFKELVEKIFPEYAISDQAIVLDANHNSKSSPVLVNLEGDSFPAVVTNGNKNGNRDLDDEDSKNSIDEDEQMSTDEDEEEEDSDSDDVDDELTNNSNAKENPKTNSVRTNSTYNAKLSAGYSSGSSSSPPADESTFDLEERLESFSEPVRNIIMDMSTETSKVVRCSYMEKLLTSILEDDDFGVDSIGKLAACLVHVLRCDLARDTYPVDPLAPHVNNPPSLASLREAITYPLYVIFRSLCSTPALSSSSQNEDESRDPHDILLSLVCEMANCEPRLGTLLLFFLRVTNSDPDTPSATLDPKRTIYREFVKESGRELSASLISDADFAQKYNGYLFFYLVPDMFVHFASMVSGNATLIYSIVSNADAKQLQEIVVHLLLGKYRIFKKDSIISVLNMSLEWDTIEQYWLWQLIIAQGYPVETVLPILPKLGYRSNAEALTNVLLLMQREPPSSLLIKSVLSREFEQDDDFVNSIFKVWEVTEEKELVDLISAQLLSKTNSPNKRKRQNIQKVNSTPQISPAAENILAHLNHYRPHAKNTFFNQEALKSCLSQVYSLCSETQKSKFSALFSVAGVIDAVDEKNDGKSKLVKGKSSNKVQMKEESDTESDISEDEAPKVKNAKQAANRKKRKVAAAASDSD